MDDYEKVFTEKKENNIKMFDDYGKSAEELKKRYKYVWKNKFL